MLETWPDLPGLARASPQAIARVRGVGPVRALRLHAALGLGMRAQARSSVRGASLQTCDDAAAWVSPGLQNLEREELHALFLDRRLRPLCLRTVTTGSDAHTVVDSRQILKIALEVGATAFVIAHNHPSGVAEPSHADETLTQALRQALALVDIRVLDHFIVAGSGVLSFAERGLL